MFFLNDMQGFKAHTIDIFVDQYSVLNLILFFLDNKAVLSIKLQHQIQ